MNILAQICEHKRQALPARQRRQPPESLRQQPGFDRRCHSMKAALLHARSSGIIAEFKRRSPSRGPINPEAPVAAVTRGYAQAGAAALSVLTDSYFFGAQPDDFALARAATTLPLLRKDFIVDAYQLVESKAMGADVVLLIAAVLPPPKLRDYVALAHELGMEVLLETHNLAEIEANRDCGADMWGINHRDLTTFTTDLNVGASLVSQLPVGCVAVAESGIHSVEAIRQLQQQGFSAFLIGEWLMRQPQPAAFCAKLINQLQHED